MKNKKSLIGKLLNSDKTSGFLLILCTIVSLAFSNSALQQSYTAIWEFHIGGHTFVHWINDGLMAVFFLLIGLELEREVYIGELSTIKKASLPALAALGGMMVPAGLFLLVNIGASTQSGAGISMATDIAFAMGVLSLLGKRVPTSLKVFLTALAVIDDLGAILVIAIFYTSHIALGSLAIAIGIFVVLLILNKIKVNSLWPYLVGGAFMWYFMLNSGIHATITGVMLAFTIPFRRNTQKNPSYMLLKALHHPVTFVVLPLFALANTCVIFETNWYSDLLSANSIGIMLGLIVGKPLGIFTFSFVAVWSGLCALPENINWKHILGVGILGGIGFTMSIFITLLAFTHEADIINSKIAVLIASFVAGLAGFLCLFAVLKKKNKGSTF